MLKEFKLRFAPEIDFASKTTQLGLFERQLLKDLYKIAVNLHRLATWLERDNLNEIALEIMDIQKEFTGINRYFMEVLRHGR